MKKFMAICLAACLVLSFTGCGKTEEKTVKEVMVNKENEPHTTTVKYRDIESTDYTEGQVTYYTTELTFPKEGKFGSFLVGLGDEVKAGDVIATSDTENAEDQLEALQDTLDGIQSDYDYSYKIKNLELERLNLQLQETYSDIDDQVYMSAKFTELCTQAGVYANRIKEKELEIKHLTEQYNLDYPYYAGLISEAKEKLSSNVITAPYDGIVVALASVQSGDHISLDNFYVGLADPSRLVLVTDYIQERQYDSYTETYVLIDGNRYSVEYMPLDEDVYIKIRARGDDVITNFLITNGDANVTCGDFGTFAGVKAKADHVLSIPAICTEHDTGGTFVYTKVNGERTKTYITLGVTGCGYSEVKEGLEEGDEVYEDD